MSPVVSCPSPVSRKAREMPSFIAMDVLETAQAMERGGEHIVHLEVGEPDFETPAVVRQAAVTALQEGETHYTHSLGLYELRGAIAAHYRARYGVDVDPERVVVTNGTSPAILLALAALLDPGDRVALTDPHYACYPNFVRFCDGEPVYVPVREEEAFQFMPDDLAAVLGGRTKAALVNSPANPTGTLIDGDRLAEVVRRVESAGAFVVSDEIYHGLVYEGRERSALEFTDRAFVLNGFSKLYAMTGWRLGYLIAPAEFVRPIQKLQQNLFIAANAFVQRAGIAALSSTGREVAEMVRTYDARRRYMLGRLEGMGFHFRCHPTGAFYVFANVKHLTDDCYRLAFDILEKARVGCAPGVDFGPGGEGYLRFTYANSLENIKEGMDRLERYLDDLGRVGA